MQVEAKAKQKLSDVQLAEIKKAFSMVDQDGSGFIDAKELQTLLTAVLNTTPSESEMQQILRLVDSNNDGVIEYAEFLSAMTDWLQEDYNRRGSSSTASKKKRGHQEEERHDVHKKIKGFFSQFQKTDKLSEIREKLASQNNAAFRGMYEVDRMDIGFGRGSYMEKVNTSQQKLETLLYCRQILPEFASIARALHSDDTYTALEAAKNLSKIASLVEIFDSPNQRRPIADTLVQLFELFVQYSVPQRLVKLLSVSGNPQLQYEAAHLISLFAPGPRIASTPADSLLHPDQMFFKKLIISEGAIPLLISLLSSHIAEVKDKATAALGAIATYNPECRDYILACQGLTALVHQISTSTPAPLLRRLAWAVSVLCGVSHPANALPAWDVITPCFPALALMLFSSDEDVLVQVCETLALVLPGVPEPNIDKRLIEILASQSYVIQKAALQPIINVLRLDERQTNVLLRFGLAQAISHVLNSTDANTRLAACEALIVLAGVRGHISPIIEVNMGPRLLELLSDELSRWKAVKVLKYISRGTPSQVRYLVNLGMIQVLTQSLVHVKEYDRVLTSVYKFYGASFNYEYVRDIIITLQNIINVGELEADDYKHTNRYALAFDMEIVDKLQSLVATLSSNSNQNAWKKPLRDGDKSIEDSLKWLFYKLKQAHDINAHKDVLSSHVSNMLLSIWQRFFAAGAETQQQQATANTTTVAAETNTTAAAAAAPTTAQMGMPENLNVLLKLYWNDEKEVRVMEVDSTILYTDLHVLLNNKFQTTVTISYKDEEGDTIAIDDDRTWQAAVHHYQKTHSRSLRLYVVGHSMVMGSSPRTSPMNSPRRRAYTNSPQRVPLHAEPLSTTPPPSTSSLLDRVAAPLATLTSSSLSSDAAAASTAASTAASAPLVPAAVAAPLPSVFVHLPSNLKDALNFSLSANLADFRRVEKQLLFESLETNTHFGKQELEQLHDHWAKQAVDGKLKKEQFAQGLQQLGITDSLVVEQNFAAFDSDKDGTIDFREFVIGLSIILRGTVDERLQFMFKAYDADGSGFLEPAEVLNILYSSFESKGIKVTQPELQDMVTTIFKEIDTNNDGKLSFEEFKLGVEHQKMLINCFVHTK